MRHFCMKCNATFYPDIKECAFCAGKLVARKVVNYKKYIVKYYKQEEMKPPGIDKG